MDKETEAACRPPMQREERSNRVRVGKTYIRQVNDDVNVKVGQVKKLLEGVPDDAPFYSNFPKTDEASLTDGYRVEIEVVDLIGLRLRGEEHVNDIVEYVPIETALGYVSQFGSEWMLVGKSFKAVRIGEEEPDYEL